MVQNGQRGLLRPPGSPRALFFVIIGLLVVSSLLFLNFWYVSGQRNELRQDLELLEQKHQFLMKEKRTVDARIDPLMNSVSTALKQAKKDREKAVELEDQLKQKQVELLQQKDATDRESRKVTDLEETLSQNQVEIQRLKDEEQRLSGQLQQMRRELEEAKNRPALVPTSALGIKNEPAVEKNSKPAHQTGVATDTAKQQVNILGNAHDTAIVNSNAVKIDATDKGYQPVASVQSPKVTRTLNDTATNLSMKEKSIVFNEEPGIENAGSARPGFAAATGKLDNAEKQQVPAPNREKQYAEEGRNRNFFGNNTVSRKSFKQFENSKEKLAGAETGSKSTNIRIVEKDAEYESMPLRAGFKAATSATLKPVVVLNQPVPEPLPDVSGNLGHKTKKVSPNSRSKTEAVLNKEPGNQEDDTDSQKPVSTERAESSPVKTNLRRSEKLQHKNAGLPSDVKGKTGWTENAVPDTRTIAVKSDKATENENKNSDLQPVPVVAENEAEENQLEKNEGIDETKY